MVLHVYMLLQLLHCSFPVRGALYPSAPGAKPLPLLCFSLHGLPFTDAALHHLCLLLRPAQMWASARDVPDWTEETHQSSQRSSRDILLNYSPRCARLCFCISLFYHKEPFLAERFQVIVHIALIESFHHTTFIFSIRKTELSTGTKHQHNFQPKRAGSVQVHRDPACLPEYGPYSL
jgi:hypothetical protein